jgi:hypothetical protein
MKKQQIAYQPRRVGVFHTILNSNMPVGLICHASLHCDTQRGQHILNGVNILQSITQNPQDIE